MDKRRIALIGTADSVHLQRWAMGLAGRFDISVFSYGGTPIQEVATHIYPRLGVLGYLKHIPTLNRELSEFSPDVVHAHSATGPAFWGAYCGIKPLVISVWGSDVDSIARTTIGKPIVGSFLRNADAITCTSNYLRDVTAELYPTLLNRLHVIPFGIPFPANPAPWPDSSTIRICCPKLHRRVYGIDVLIEAVAMLVRAKHEVELTLPGVGPETGRFRKMIRSLRIESRVHFPGLVPRASMPDLLAAHHIVANPSRREGFGMALIEAAAAGRPVVATNVGGIPEIVRHGVTGLLVPPDNAEALAAAIGTFATDMNHAKGMGDAAFRLIRDKYRWEDSLDSMSNLYNSLIHAAKKK